MTTTKQTLSHRELYDIIIIAPRGSGKTNINHLLLNL